ncbi:MAG TPA: anti-sigma regulatory factor [Dehalococcoidia bacterium]|jgi:serine/threonine-protein kinase RsbT|nr:anti-sigma regulatory factor [Dehalococcoidia bacterium]
MPVRVKSKQERIKIRNNFDVAEATLAAQRLAELAGFSRSQQFMVSTAVSELARNIFIYAKEGEVTIRILERDNQRGIEVVAEDRGPGIADVDAALKDGFSTSGGLGLGLPGARRLMDELEIDTKLGVGTKVTARKWVEA